MIPIEDFIIPDFLQNETVESIHARMLNSLPSDVDIDKSEGQFLWDFTRPTALEKQYFVEYKLVEAIKLIFPMFSSGIYLDYHAESRNMKRKSATASVGTITITGAAGVEIPLGARFMTESGNGVASVDFITTENASIPTNGSIDIRVRCTIDGVAGNVGAGTIVLKDASLPSGITGITNNLPTTGGTDIESDEELRNRIVEYDQNLYVSYVGSLYDYKRWSLEVDGVGDATPIPPNDDSGVVTIILLDANHEPANDELCQAVSNHILSPDDPMQRLTSINATVIVRPPTAVTIEVSAKITLDKATTLDNVKAVFANKLKNYLNSTPSVGIKYSAVAALLYNTEGVVDYQNLRINNDTANIDIEQDELPVCGIEHINFTL